VRYIFVCYYYKQTAPLGRFKREREQRTYAACIFVAEQPTVYSKNGERILPAVGAAYFCLGYGLVFKRLLVNGKKRFEETNSFACLYSIT
jgi:hypothetical protein